MATKKKSKTGTAIDMTLSIGNSVSVVSSTIFDHKGELSDLLATGTITKVNPEPGWDYEVTFDGVLSLEGRPPMQSRLYNKHQIVKAVKVSEVPTKIDNGLYDALRDEVDAVRDYNYMVMQIKELCTRITKCTVADRLAELYAQRDNLLSSLPAAGAKIKRARRQLADAIRSLLGEETGNQTDV